MGKKKPRIWADTPTALPQPVIDNHTHLPLAEEQIPRASGIRLPLQEQLERATLAGVSGLITCGCELADLEPTVALAHKFDNVWAAVAIHPNEVPLHRGLTGVGPDGLTPRMQDQHQVSLEDAIAAVADLLTDPKVVAVGETGLDYFRTDEAGQVVQQEAFRAHIALAKESELAMQIHDREAHSDTVRILREEVAPERTVFHCFSGDKELAEVLAQHGWYASFAGPLTYPVNKELRQALSVMPKELVLVETDAPYLTPQPYRGQPNASYLMGYTVQAISEIWQQGLTETCNQLMENTKRAYSI